MPITITSSDGAVAAVPYLLGFDPQDSLVILFNGPAERQLTLRVDLPPSPEVNWMQTILNGLNHPLPDRAILVAYANSATPFAASQTVQWAADVLAPMMHIVDVLLVAEGRLQSLREPDDGGIPVEDLLNHPVVAECVAAGLSKVARREHLVGRLEPVTDAVSEAVVAHLDRPLKGGYEQRRDRLEKRSVRVLCGQADLSPSDIAAVGRACSDWFVRDPMISVILKRHARSQVLLARVRTRLTYALVHLPEELAGPVAATLALLSWADGDGAAALVAVDRARGTDPTNSLAPLVEQALQNGLPPSTWSDVTSDIPMDVLRGRDRRRSA